MDKRVKVSKETRKLIKKFIEFGDDIAHYFYDSDSHEFKFRDGYTSQFTLYARAGNILLTYCGDNIEPACGVSFSEYYNIWDLAACIWIDINNNLDLDVQHRRFVTTGEYLVPEFNLEYDGKSFSMGKELTDIWYDGLKEDIDSDKDMPCEGPYGGAFKDEEDYWRWKEGSNFVTLF